MIGRPFFTSFMEMHLQLLLVTLLPGRSGRERAIEIGYASTTAASMQEVPL